MGAEERQESIAVGFQAVDNLAIRTHYPRGADTFFFLSEKVTLDRINLMVTNRAVLQVKSRVVEGKLLPTTDPVVGFAILVADG